MNGKLTATLLVSLVVIAAVAVGYFIWSDSQDQEFKEDIRDTIKEDVTTSNPLIGKPATADSRAVDRGNDNTQVGALLYFILSPTVSDGEIAGNFAADGVTMSASSRTSTTSGITVGTKYVAIASNNTYFGFPTAVKEIGKRSDGSYEQSELVDLDVYTTASSVQITVKDEDETALTNGGGVNLTLASNEAETLSEIKLKVNQSNVALNLAGFFFDKVANTNVSAVDKASGYSGSPSFSESSLNLAYTEADDTVFEFDSPILLKEQGSITITDGITVSAKASGCSGENLVMYFFDKIWTKSTKADKMIYAAESDADTEADIGMTNPSFTIVCNSA